MMKNILIVLIASLAVATAFVAPSAARPMTKLSESFGFDFAEDTYSNQPEFLKGEGEYKTFVGKTQDNSFLNRQVSATFMCSSCLLGSYWGCAY